MPIDVVAIALILFFAFIGFMSGALRQLLHVGGAMLAYGVARVFGPGVGRTITSWPDPVPLAIGAAVVFMATFIAAHFVGVAIIQTLKRAKTVDVLDRVLGGLLGAAKSVLIVWVILSALVLLENPPEGFKWKYDPRGSLAASWAREHNLLGIPPKAPPVQAPKAPTSSPAPAVKRRT
jgi:membrane protein required for colicin V production